MAHRFKLYDVGIDNQHYDTGKIILVELLPIFSDNGVCGARGDVVERVCESFGFTQYCRYYHPSIGLSWRTNWRHVTKPGDIYICYDNGDGHDGHTKGLRPVWFLERGA